MTKDEINKFINHQQKVSDRNYQNYQQSGEQRYYRAYDRAEELIGLASQALSAADDHQMVISLRADLSALGTMAFDAVHSQDIEQYKNVVSSVAAIARTYGLGFNRWE